MKRFFVIAGFFVLGILLGYYYRDVSVEEELQQKLYEYKIRECERKIKECDRSLKMINSDYWELEWDRYLIKEDYPF